MTSTNDNQFSKRKQEKILHKYLYTPGSVRLIKVKIWKHCPQSTKYFKFTEVIVFTCSWMTVILYHNHHPDELLITTAYFTFSSKLNILEEWTLSRTMIAHSTSIFNDKPIIINTFMWFHSFSFTSRNTSVFK